jgi:hypothetical protein
LSADVTARLARLDQIERAAAEAEKAKLSEVDRVKAEKAELEVKLTAQADAHRGQLINSAIALEGSKKGLKNPTLYASLIDKSKMTVTPTGEVKGVAEALDALKATAPELFGAAAAAAVKTGPDAPDPGKPGGKPEPLDGSVEARAKALIASVGLGKRRRV